ncbi:unnamed protein product [Soboliphyme baturini]|uniref:Endo/exonuclease/phosphatase domain-containing protein n=1 Tax=Soboliphyme baturini TaxID=241478 RepID=A0A183J346_9BILA|nr:unnamed protein product [Soboliphyme baturini]
MAFGALGWIFGTSGAIFKMPLFRGLDIPVKARRIQRKIIDSALSRDANQRQSLVECRLVEHEVTKRLWEPLNCGRRPDSGAGNDSISFTLCSYNVLSQSCLENTSRLYRRCEPLHLSWKYRWQNLFYELQSLDADIFCLQEVDGAFFGPYYLRLFEQAGFDGIFRQRTGDKLDGCATFWRRALFTLTDSRELTFFRPDARLTGHNVGVIVSLSPRDRHQCRLIVGNTHLIYNPKRGDLKLAQAAILLAHVQQVGYFFPLDHCRPLND